MTSHALVAVCMMALQPGLLAQVVAKNDVRHRGRELGIVVGNYSTGQWNAITDVPGVLVGQTTFIRGSGPLHVGEGPVRTGVTAVLARKDVWSAGCLRPRSH